MPWAIQQLLSRGYWEEAGDGTGGSSGGAGDGAGGGADPSAGTGAGAGDPPKPSEAEAKLLKEVMNKKNRIKTLEDELNGMKSSLERFSGIDPEQVAKLLKEKDDAEKARLESKGEWEKLKERMASEHTKEKQTLADQIEQYKAQLTNVSQTIERLTVGHNFDNSKFITGETILTPRKARLIYGSYFDVDANGSVVGFDKPRGESGRAQLINGEGNPLPFEEAVKRLVDADPDRDDILRSKRKPGAGSGTEGGKPTDMKKPMSPRDKIALGLSQRAKK